MDMEIAMIFRVDYSMPVQNVTAAQERFGTMEEKWDGVKLIGRWHEAGNKGFAWLSTLKMPYRWVIILINP